MSINDTRQVSPAEWGAMIDYDGWNYGPWQPDKWVVHYGGGANFAGDPQKAAEKGYDFPSVEAEKKVLQLWEYYHVKSRGWRGIAYNYAIGQSGTLYRLRGENRAGATSGDFEGDGIPENVEARAVVFILGGDQQPTEAALRTFAYFWAEDQKPVIVHSDVKATACPGDFLRRWVHEERFRLIIEEEYMALDDGDIRRIAEAVWSFPGLDVDGKNVTTQLMLSRAHRNTNTLWNAYSKGILCKIDPETIALAIVDALGKEIALQVVDELSRRLSE